jgi:hypothetical protein
MCQCCNTWKKAGVLMNRFFKAVVNLISSWVTTNNSHMDMYAKCGSTNHHREVYIWHCLGMPYLEVMWCINILTEAVGHFQMCEEYAEIMSLLFLFCQLAAVQP